MQQQHYYAAGGATRYPQQHQQHQQPFYSSPQQQQRPPLQQQHHQQQRQQQQPAYNTPAAPPAPHLDMEEIQRVRQKFLHVPPVLTATAPRYDPFSIVNCKIDLYPHQLAMIQRLFDADEYITKGKAATEVFVKGACGCGKTYALLGFAVARKLLKQRQRGASGNKRNGAAVLIIVPSTLVIQWKEAVKAFGCNLTLKVLESYSDIMSLYVSTATFTRNDIVLTSIENYPVLRDTLTGLNLSLEVVIVDEVDGVAECQRIDCASMMSTPSSTSALQSMNMNPDANGQPHLSVQQLSKVKPIPAIYVIRVSATMDIPPSVHQNHEVTVVECDNAFISTSIKLEPPVVNVVRCKDAYIHSVLRHVLNTVQLNAMHALDFRSALRGLPNINNALKLESPIDVIKVILDSYSSQLELNENIIDTYIESFPYLEDLDPLYGKEFQTLLTTNAQGDSEVRFAPSMSPELRNLMTDLTNNVSIHICEKYDDTKEEIKSINRCNELLRRKMAAADLCPGGCGELLSKQARIYCSPCCSLEICISCVDQQQQKESLKGRCCICRHPVLIKAYHLYSPAKPEAKTKSKTETEGDQALSELMEDKKTALIQVIMGRKIELQEARAAYFESKAIENQDESVAVTDGPRKKKVKVDSEDSLPPPVPKFIVGSAFSETLIHLESELNERGVKTAHLEAGSGPKTNAIVRQFWDTEEIDVLFCQLSTIGSSVGRGLNLQIGSDVIFFERPSPAMAEQLRGRLQRVGRVSTLQVWNILHENE